MKGIYIFLKCCFDFFDDSEKKCFFYTALYLEDSDIQKDNLLDNWAAEELPNTIDDAEETRANGREVLHYLKMHSLLEENEPQQCFRIHKLIHLAALYSLSTDGGQGILVKFGEALDKPVDVECWKNKRWISLVDRKMSALPAKLICPKLSTLFLQKNPNWNLFQKHSLFI
ncbi:unnamed protein product [Lactuca virosa]|uniref:Disease resistance protein winged helix domain-containing protein n=1 Tax=Lactuca virosa TaxID=75947 RepID=A0AAU9P4K2_9ASTR|nr:unnamed protein product [Lactuca virosa]